MDFNAIKGFENLTTENQKAFITFAEKCGIADITPISVNWVEEVGFAVIDPDDDNNFIASGGRTYSLGKDGQKELIKEWADVKYSHLPQIADPPQQYLRFDYQEGNRPTWLHITKDGQEWY